MLSSLVLRTEFLGPVALHYCLFLAREALGDCFGGNNEASCTDVKERWQRYEINVTEVTYLLILVTALLLALLADSYRRYTYIEQSVWNLIGRMDSLCLSVHVHLHSPDDRFSVMRFLLTSLKVTQFGIRTKQAASGDKNNGRRKSRRSRINEDSLDFDSFLTEELVNSGLLNAEEADYLKRFEGNKQELLCSWSILAMKRVIGSKASHQRMSQVIQNEEKKLALRAVTHETKMLRDAIGSVGNALVSGVPDLLMFLINFSLFSGLIFLAYGLLFLADGAGNPISFLLVPVTALILVGMKELGATLASPFGDSFSDLQVEKQLEKMTHDCVAMIKEGGLSTKGVEDSDPQPLTPEHHRDSRISAYIEQNTVIFGRLQDLMDKLITFLTSGADELRPKAELEREPEPSAPQPLEPHPLAPDAATSLAPARGGSLGLQPVSSSAPQLLSPLDPQPLSHHDAGETASSGLGLSAPQPLSPRDLQSPDPQALVSNRQWQGGGSFKTSQPDAEAALSPEGNLRSSSAPRSPILVPSSASSSKVVSPGLQLAKKSLLLEAKRAHIAIAQVIPHSAKYSKVEAEAEAKLRAKGLSAEGLRAEELSTSPSAPQPGDFQAADYFRPTYEEDSDSYSD